MAPRKPQWTPEVPLRKPHGTPRDPQETPNGPTRDPQGTSEASDNTRKTRDGQDLTKDWRNMFKNVETRENTYELMPRPPKHVKTHMNA